MNIEPKISGYAITDFEIVPLQNALTLGNFKKLSLRSIKYIINNYRIYEDAKYTNQAITLLSLDDTYKIAILESYPEYEYEMKLYFGENWLDYYLRFNH